MGNWRFGSRKSWRDYHYCERGSSRILPSSRRCAISFEHGRCAMLASSYFNRANYVGKATLEEKDVGNLEICLFASLADSINLLFPLLHTKALFTSCSRPETLQHTCEASPATCDRAVEMQMMLTRLADKYHAGALSFTHSSTLQMIDGRCSSSRPFGTMTSSNARLPCPNGTRDAATFPCEVSRLVLPFPAPYPCSHGVSMHPTKSN